MIITIISDAKCKHCKYFKHKWLVNRDGSKSKKPRAYCSNIDSDYFTLLLTLKSKACNKLEL